MNKKETFVNEIMSLTAKKEIVDFFIVKEALVKEGKNGEYGQFLLADKTGEIVARKWTIEDSELTSLNGKIIRVKAEVNFFKDNTQLIISKFREVDNSADEIIDNDFVVSAPENPNEMFEYILKVSKTIENKNLEGLIDEILNKNKEHLLYFPAAKSNHHAYKGGLLYHTKRMLMMGLKYLEVYKDLNKDLVIAGIILHDYGKLIEFDALENGIVKKYSKEGSLLSHIVIGILEFDKLKEKHKISDELSLLLRHIILSHHNLPEYGSPVMPAFLEAELIHHLDICDAKLSSMKENLDNVVTGETSERIFGLENRVLYKFDPEEL